MTPRLYFLLTLSLAASAQNDNSNSAIRCFKCNSRNIANCANQILGLPIDECRDPQDKCITAIVNGVTYRGCEKELNVPNYAFSENCNLTLCNRKLFPNNRLQCYQCKGNKCVKFEDFKNNLKACVNYVEKDYCVIDVIDETNVIRGCYSDTGYIEKEYTKVCDTSGCNSDFHLNSVACARCSQTDGKSCVRRTEPIQYPRRCKIPQETSCLEKVLLNHPSCFTYKKPGELVRGCIKEVDKLGLDKKYIETCYGEFCNNKCLPIKCIKCNTKHEPKCANGAFELTAEQCSHSQSYCVTGKTQDGKLVRSCGGYDDISRDQKIQNSTYCYKDGCNKEIYVPPPDISKNFNCYQCKNHEHCNDISYPSKAYPCNSPTDTCFQYLDNQNKMVRGCKSDKEYSECLAQGEKCYQCTTEGCNDRSIFRESDANSNPITCVQCDKYNDDCAFDLKAYRGSICTPKSIYYKDEFTCYSCLESNYVAERGCLIPNSINKTNSNCAKYETCNTNYCNTKSLIEQKCIQCSGTEKICNKGVSGTPCNYPLTYNTMGCFTKQTGNHLIRGCVSKFLGQQVCQDTEKFCHVCKGQNCNSSEKVKFSLTLAPIFAPFVISLYLTI